MKLTRSNIAHDLNISPHKLAVFYEDNSEVVYVFSSDWYRTKFQEKMMEHRKTINQSLSNRFGFAIKVSKLADLKLYTTIEKRGFLIYNDGVKTECLDTIVLSGHRLMSKS